MYTAFERHTSSINNELFSIEHRYDPRLVTLLVHNYRAHPSIMNVYSELSYDNGLKAMVNDVDSDEAQTLKQLRPILPTEEQGVIFIGVEGKNEKGNDSPSWFNEQEVTSVSSWTEKNKVYLSLTRYIHRFCDFTIN